MATPACVKSGSVVGRCVPRHVCVVAELLCNGTIINIFSIFIISSISNSIIIIIIIIIIIRER